MSKIRVYAKICCAFKFTLSNLRFQKKKRVCETLHAVSNLLFRRQMRHYCLV
jgi:hypothetical protein